MTLAGLHHLGLTVTDVERSARWYERVLGFERVGAFENADRQKVFLRHDGLGVRLGLVQHNAARSGRFDETVAGLDHLAFTVPDVSAWVSRLDEAGVAFSPPVSANTIPGALVLVLRDPDNIQLELISDPLRSAAIVQHFELLGRDNVAAADVYTDDAVLEYVQSGERISGKANIVASREAYPGRTTRFEVRRLVPGPIVTVELVMHIDGDDPHPVVAILELRGEQVCRERIYIAEPWPAPSYRAEWSQPLP
jgi:glyoxylase I family protein